MLTIDNAGYVTYPVFRGELDVQLLNQLLCLLLLEVHDGVKDLEGGGGRRREEGERKRKEEEEEGKAIIVQCSYHSRFQ